MPKTNGTTIVAVEAENFRRLRVAHLQMVPGEGLVRVTGKNASGKTSLLKAIAAALGGAGEIHPDSLRDGADSGRVTLRLSNGFTVERRFTEAAPKGYLTVTGPDDGKHTQTKLNAWLGERSFDPLSFLSLAPDRQRDALFSVATDPGLPGKLQRVRDEYAETYQERTPIIARRRHLRALSEPEGERPEPVDVSSEMEALGELEDVQRERQSLLRAADNMEGEAGRYPERIEYAEAEVARLEALLEEARADVVRLNDEAALAAKRAKDARKKAEAHPDPSDQIAEVRARIAGAEEVRRALAPWERWDAAQEELAGLVEDEEKLTAQLGALKRREADLLDKAGIPVEGLSFSDSGEPLLNGHPLALASGRERIEVAVAVALAANPDLRVCLLDEANDMDLEALERLDALAREHGFQVWAVRIGLEGPGEVVVDDGEARDRDAEVAPELELAAPVEG